MPADIISSFNRLRSISIPRWAAGHMMRLEFVYITITLLLATTGDDAKYANDPFWKDLVLFYEYFDGDDGRGCGAR